MEVLLNIFVLTVSGMILLIGLAMYISFFNSVYYRTPQVASFSEDLKLIKDNLQKYPFQNKKFIDLGSGTGKAIRFFEKNFNCKTTGIEGDLFNHIISKFINYIKGYSSKSIKQNFFKADLEDYDIIYIYISNNIPKLENFILSNTKKGVYIIANSFPLKTISPIETIKDKKGRDKIFIYKV